MALPVADWAKQPGYTGGHGPWFVNAGSGKLSYEPGLLGQLGGFFAQAVGWYGFDTQADAVAALKVMTGKTATSSTTQAARNEVDQEGADAAGGLAGILPTFENTRGFAVRAVKVVAGVALLITGLSIIGKGALPSGVRGLPIPV